MFVLGLSFIIIILIMVLILYLLPVIAYFKIFNKAGIPGWKSLIPIYNVYLSYKIAGMSGLWIIPLYGCIIASCFIEDYNTLDTWLAVILLIASILATIGAIIKAFKFPKAFGKGVLFAIIMIIFPFVCELILAFGSAKYVGNYKNNK